MKKVVLILVVVLSFTYTYAANRLAVTKTYEFNLPYVEEEEPDALFDFDYKTYLPKEFCAYDLDDNEIDPNLWVDESEDETLDFDTAKYLPIGFISSKELNYLFLNEVKWIEEEEIIAFDFEIEKYLKIIIL